MWSIKTITLNGLPYTIVGVMHADWRFGGPRYLAVFAARVYGWRTDGRGVATF